MNKKLEVALVVCGYSVLFISTFALAVYLGDILDLFYAKLSDRIGKVAASFVLLAVILTALAASYIVHKLCAAFTQKITNNYNSFKNENNVAVSEVYDDPTVKLKDKIIFFHIYLIYYLQLPFLVCASKVPNVNNDIAPYEIKVALTLINLILLLPVILLELIKYPLVKLFSPLGLGIKSLSFLFNISDVSNNSQNVHTSSFEYSIIQCANELKEKFEAQKNELDKEFASYINKSDELTEEQKEQLKNYINFSGSNRANWSESRTGLTLTQAVNLVLTAAKKQNLDMQLLKGILLVRLQEGNRQCYLGMFNRIIYSLSCLEAKNNFTVQINSQVYEEMPRITKKFFKEKCNRSQIETLKQNFDDYYCGHEISDKAKGSINSLLIQAEKFIFNELYVKFYKDYGQDVGRGPIKQKLQELITNDDVKEAVSNVIDDIEVPPTFLRIVKAFFICSNGRTQETELS